MLFRSNDNGERKAECANDGLLDTYWASNPNNDNRNERQMLTIELDEIGTMNGVYYTPRQKEDEVGNIGRGYLEYSEDGVNWKRVELTEITNEEGNESTGSLINSDNEFVMDTKNYETRRISFKPVKAKYIRLVAEEAAHWRADLLNSVVAAAEIGRASCRERV